MLTLPIYPGETVYSWLIRHIILSGLPSPRVALNHLLGACHLQLTAQLPSFISSLAKQSPYEIDFLLNKHTSLNYFKVFSQSQKFSNLKNQLKAGLSISMINQHGWLATLSKQPKVLRFCPTCITEDEQNFGVAFWRVEHQLPGCIACHKHKVYLVEIRRWRNMVELPPQQTKSSTTIASSPALKLSQLSFELMNCPEADLDQKQLAYIYRIRLAEKSAATKTSKLHVNQKKFRKYITEQWAELLSEPSIASVIELGNGQMYPQCMVHNKQVHPPLRHLLVIGTLFDSISEMVDYYHSAKLKHLSLLNSQQALPSPPSSYSKSLIKKAINLLKQGNSINAVARKLSCGAKTIKRIAIHNNINIIRKSKFLHQAERREIWRKLVIGSSIKDIAKLMACSTAAISLELSYYVELLTLRKKVRYYKLRQKHRSIMVQAIKAAPHLNRSQLQKRYKATYSWLHKNERNWLNTQLPPRVITAKQRK